MKMTRKKLFFVWLLFLVACGVAFYQNASTVQHVFSYIGAHSVTYIYIIIFVLGLLRGFTLIPVTYLIILGLIFIPPLPLFFIIISGVIFSSLSVYYFFQYLRVDKMLDKKYQPYIDKATNYLKRYELPVITLWAMAPFLPSDIICYVSGTLKVNVYKFALGMFIGEGVMCATYIFGGAALLQYFHGAVF